MCFVLMLSSLASSSYQTEASKRGVGGTRLARPTLHAPTLEKDPLVQTGLEGPLQNLPKGMASLRA